MSQGEGLKAIPEQGDKNYDVKTFVWHNSPTRFSIMVVRFDVGEGDPFAIEGFSGKSAFFVCFSGGTFETHYDPYKIDRVSNEGNLRRFLLEIFKGVESEGNVGIRWESLQDGFKYNPSFVEGLLD